MFHNLFYGIFEQLFQLKYIFSGIHVREVQTMYLKPIISHL